MLLFLFHFRAYYSDMDVKKTQHRLFFALWPSDEVRNEIKKQVQPLIKQLKQHPAKKVPPHNWHITLAFLGNVSSETKQCVIEQAGVITGSSFALQLNEFGFFKRASVVWLGTKQCPDVLKELVEHLNKKLADCGYQSEFKDYTPHLTFLRKAYKPLDDLLVEPVHWQVNEFVLVESVTTDRGARYQVINRWPLNE